MRTVCLIAWLTPFGRFNELSHVNALNYNWPTGDGYQWYLQAPGKGLQTGNTVQLGAAACWYYEDSQGNPTGHAAIVEQINYDANNNVISFITSNSAWYRVDPDDPYSSEGTPVEAFPYWYTRTIYPASIDSVPGHPEAYFQGFVYHPLFPPGDNPMSEEELILIMASKKRTRLKHVYMERRK